MIYVARQIGSESVKIGYTKDRESLRVRLKALMTGSPIKIKIEAVMPGSQLKERCLHGFCIKRHVRGEWFRLNSDEVQRLVSKYRDWTPGSAGITRAPCIHHLRNQ